MKNGQVFFVRKKEKTKGPKRYLIASAAAQVLSFPGDH